MTDRARRRLHQDWALLVPQKGRFEGQEMEESKWGGTRAETGALSRDSNESCNYCTKADTLSLYVSGNLPTQMPCASGFRDGKEEIRVYVWGLLWNYGVSARKWR